MDFTKVEENKESLLRTNPNGSQLDIKNTHFGCILKWLFFIDLHLNLPPFGSVLYSEHSEGKCGTDDQPEPDHPARDRLRRQHQHNENRRDAGLFRGHKRRSLLL